MAKELRKIILSPDELMVALSSYKRTNFDFLPVGKIVNCEVKANSPVVVSINSTGTDTEKSSQFVIKPADLLEPLIKYCIENNIVLPHNSRKTILVGDEQAVLFIQIGTLTDNI